MPFDASGSGKPNLNLPRQSMTGVISRPPVGPPPRPPQLYQIPSGSHLLKNQSPSPQTTFNIGGSPLVNGHPSQDSHSDPSSRQHSPTPYISHNEATVTGDLNVRRQIASTSNPDLVNRMPKESFPANSQEQSQLRPNSSGDVNVNSTENVMSKHIGQSASSLSLKTEFYSTNGNDSANLSKPLLSGLSRSETNLANGGSSPVSFSSVTAPHLDADLAAGKHITNVDFVPVSSIAQHTPAQVGNSYYHPETARVQLSASALSTNTSSLFPQQLPVSGNIISQPSNTTQSVFTSSSPMPFYPQSSGISSLQQNVAALKPRLPTVSSQSNSLQPSLGQQNPFPNQSQIRQPLITGSPQGLAPLKPVTSVVAPNNFTPRPTSSAMVMQVPESMPGYTSVVGPLPSPVVQPSSSIMRPPSASWMKLPPTHPTPAVGLPPASRIGPPYAAMGGPSPTSIGGPRPTSMARPSPSSLIGPRPTSVAGLPPTSLAGQPPTYMVGPPPMSMLGPPPISMAGPTAGSIVGPPPKLMAGPPVTSMVAPPSLVGPPPTSVLGPPPTVKSPPSLLVGPPSQSKVGHSLPVSRHSLPSMLVPPQSTSTQLKYTSPAATVPHVSMMRPPLISTMGPSSSTVGPPPTSLSGMSSRVAPPPVTQTGQFAAAKPVTIPPSAGPKISSGSYNSLQGPLSGNTTVPSGGTSGRYPLQQPSHNVNQLSQQLGGLSVTKDGWNRGWAMQAVDLLQQKAVLPPQGIVPPRPTLLQEYLPNCLPDVFRSTISKIPESQSVLQKSRLPFGIVIHPFKDLEHLAVVSCNTIVRCRSCRTYINPFVVFKGDKKWECNLCFRVNDLPDEFQFDPVTRTYGDPSRRPEVREATIEFIAPQEYMLRPPQPATYVWVLDVSRQAIETGYLKVVCDTLLNYLEKIPGDRRTLIGFITYSTTIQYYLMGEGLKSIQMLEVGEVNDIFIPSPDDLLVHLEESKTQIEELLMTLPATHNNNIHTQTAFGAALTAAYKLVAPIGGRITAMASILPTIGPGALKPREDPNQRSAKDISNLGPATDFYKKLALDCSGQQVAVDLFTFNSQYIDLATLSGISKFSGGCIHHFPGFNVAKNPACVEPFKSCLIRYITRKIGFEAVMRIRATRGLAITNFHGNFFVRSTDLLSLPNINPDAGFGMQVSIEEPLHNIRQACFQAALLYTSSRGERRIRVHTLCLPVSPNVHEVIAAGDQQAIMDLLSKMAVDRCLSSQMSDAREAIVNACADILSAYKATLSTGPTGLPVPVSLQMLPLYLLALLKSVALRHGISTKLDDRVFAMCELKMLPLKNLIQTLYPDLYPIHYLSDKGAINIEDMVVPQPDHLQLSGEHLDRNGAYLMDAGSVIYVYVRSGIASDWVNDVLGVPSYAAIPQPLFEEPFPCLDNLTSELVRNFVYYLQRNKPYAVPVYIIREDNPSRGLFIQYLVDDRSEGAHSYVEFLQFIKSQVK